ncbi:MAG: hypothetical protein J0I21_20045 [Alphaproteobacteria bacterium]|nr:hypothetical protein [Alphaproteobacteria bacterium]
MTITPTASTAILVASTACNAPAAPCRRRPRLRIAKFGLALPLLALSGCGYGDSRMVHEAQISMIGMTSNDLQACAGPADKVTKLNDHAEIYTYLYKPASTGGFNVQLPLSLGGVSIGGSGTYCSADLRVVDNHVTELHYTGDNDKAIGDDGVCVPLIRGCMRQPEPTMQPVNGANYDRSSAYHSPPVPAQPPAAEEPAMVPPPATK